MLQRVGDKFSEDSGTCHISEGNRCPVAWGMLDRASKVRNRSIVISKEQSKGQVGTLHPLLLRNKHDDC